MRSLVEPFFNLILMIVSGLTGSTGDDKSVALNDETVSICNVKIGI